MFQPVAPGEQPLPPPRVFRRLAFLAGFAVLYFLAAVLGLAFRTEPEKFAIFWPPNGVLLGLLMVCDRRRWRDLLATAAATSLVANFVHGHSLWVALGFTAVNIPEAWVGAWLFRRYGAPTPSLTNSRTVFVVFLGALGLCAVSAVGGAAVVTVGLGAPDYGSVWLAFWLSDAMAIMLVTPLFLAWGDLDWRSLRAPSILRVAEAALLFAVLAGLAFFIFLQPSGKVSLLLSRPLPLYPCLLWAALRFGSRGASVAVLLVSLVAIWNTGHGRGPFTGYGALETERLLVVQVFLSLLSFSSLILVAAIAGRAMAQEALRLSVERLRLAQQAGRIGSFDWDISSGAITWSPELEGMYGLRPGEFGGTYVAWEALLHPDDRPVFGLIRNSLESGAPFEGEWRAVWSDGTTRWLAARFQIFRDTAGRTARAIGVNLDITEPRQAQEKLRQNVLELEAYFTNALDLLCIAGSDGRFLRLNMAWQTTLGYPLEELIGKSFMDFVHPDDREATLQTMGELNSQKEVLNFVNRYRRKDGTYRWIEWRAFPAGKVIYSTARDITERKKAEEERLKFQAKVQDAQRLESLGVLAGGVAHDFNNLLTSILGYAGLAEAGLPPGSPAGRDIAEVVKGARRAAELTQQMLAYSGKANLSVKPASLSALVLDMGRLLEVSIPKKCEIQFHLLPDLPACLADAVQMRQIIMNLILNAAEAIGDRSGIIAVRTGVTHCDSAYLSKASLGEDLAEGRYVYLEVSDSGCGMSEETQGRVFDPFFTTKFTGRGLGLSAVQGIVRGHKGAIAISSTLGKGSTFRVLLPATDRPVLEEPDRKGAVPQWRGSGEVLIVDDEGPVRAIAQRLLEKMGFSVRTAADGREAVEVFRKEAQHLCLVILDMTMPHLDGKEVYQEMQVIRSGVPTLLSSGYGEEAAVGRFGGKGPALFIQKPYEYQELQAAIRKILGR